MNKKPSRASAWKGDILIYAYCETRATLSTETTVLIDKIYNEIMIDEKKKQNLTV